MFVNLTPHTINVVVGDKKHEFKSEGIARVSSESKTVGEIDGIPVVDTVLGDIVGMPEPKLGVVYIVSRMVRDAMVRKGMDRQDVVCPDTGPTAIRNDKGQVVGVIRFTY
jgi:exosome complex RNA-binding protein Csl4